MARYCMVMTTFETREQAQPVAEGAVKAGLAACVQQMEIASTYIWKGNMSTDPEMLAVFKTRDDLYDELAEFIGANHPYEVPEIIKVPVEDGSASYLSWIDEMTKGE
ncbi:MAG: divalent-cation tolerance protein CutA [Coriobacteriales bacterium]|jgi:periplasmic divalent cation tolerance protein